MLHDSKKTHGKTHLIRLLKEQKPLKFFTVDKYDMRAFARAAKSHGLLFCPIRDKMDPDHIEIAILQDDASKANRIIEKLQLDVVDTGIANSPSPRADQLRAKGERPSVRMELSDITTYLRRKVEPPKDRMPRMPIKIKRKDKVL